MADPITREQVERAIPESTACNAHGVCKALGELWYRREDVPEDVRAGWGAIGYNDLTAALTRWRDELVAAEPVRRVARWDADADHYVLTPPYTHTYAYVGITTKRETAIAWGYEIEGGPEPVAHHAASERVVERLRAMTSAEALAALVEAGIVTPDGELTEAYRARPEPEPAEDSPERLRERWEALGWTTAYAGHWVPWFDHTDVERAESGKGITAFVARYAAALSAEEERRAAKHDEPWLAPVGHVIDAALGKPERPTPRFGVGDWVRVTGGGAVHQVVSVVSDLTPTRYGVGPGGALVREDDLEPATQPDRPAPRFKAGDWVRVVSNGTVYQVGEIATPFGGNAYYFRETGGAENSWQAAALEPASPPAPEVVDVPQPAAPVVKRCDTVTASWTPGKGHLTVRTMARDMDVPIALLRAMLEAIDAQQGGAS